MKAERWCCAAFLVSHFSVLLYRVVLVYMCIMVALSNAMILYSYSLG